MHIHKPDLLLKFENLKMMAARHLEKNRDILADFD